MPSSSPTADIHHPAQRIAVIGSGVSAMVCAWHLHKAGREVTVFESQARMGGHTHTHTVMEEGPGGAGALQIDTGFIVFNPVAYPNFVNLLAQLKVESRATTMGLGVHDPAANLCWSSDNPFAQKRNLLRPDFWKMLAAMPRFHREMLALVGSHDTGLTVGDFLSWHGFDGPLAKWYLLPMGAAVWSSSPKQFEDFPAVFLAQFMHNHRMLQVANRPVWRTVVGGSSAYMRQLAQPLAGRIRLNDAVSAVRRYPDHVEVDAQSGMHTFDAVVIGCHSDEALAMLPDARPAERAALAAIPYRASETVLHTDTRLMPPAKKAWTAWNVRLPEPGAQAQGLTATYWMNALQGLKCRENYLVSLNETGRIAPEKIIARMSYSHPAFTPERARAHQAREQISGHNRTHFCGAYWGWGFHEDGVRSGLQAAQELGCLLDLKEVDHAP